MKNVSIVFFLFLAVVGCAEDKQNPAMRDSFSALEGSLVGRWTTGCVSESGANQKWTFKFDGKNAVYVHRSFDKKDCSGPAAVTNGPTVFAYTVTNLPGLGQARLDVVEKMAGKVVLEAVLFDDVLTLTDMKGVKHRMTRVVDDEKK